jgi:single-stranded-DNA-specific exonuclease
LGLVASGIADQYARPVYLWGREGNDTLKGSCRGGPGKVHVIELMKAADADTFLEFGGHAASGGFSVAPDRVFDLEERLCAGFARMPKNVGADAVGADLLTTPDGASVRMLQTFEKLAPFGMGNAKPRLLIKGARIESVAWFGKAEEHLRVQVGRGDAEFPEKPIEAIVFYAKRELGKDCERVSPGAVLSLVAHLERDQFARGQPVRLRLIGVR